MNLLEGKINLTYGEEGFSEVENILKENCFEDYTLSIFNTINGMTIEISCSHEDILNAIIYISKIEHDFPEWIGINHFTNSYIVGLHFSRGIIPTPSIAEFSNDELKLR